MGRRSWCGRTWCPPSRDTMRIAAKFSEFKGKIGYDVAPGFQLRTNLGPSRKDLRRKRANYCRKPVKLPTILILAWAFRHPEESFHSVGVIGAFSPSSRPILLALLSLTGEKSSLSEMFIAYPLIWSVLLRNRIRRSASPGGVLVHGRGDLPAPLVRGDLGHRGPPQPAPAALRPLLRLLPRSDGDDRLALPALPLRSIRPSLSEGYGACSSSNNLPVPRCFSPGRLSKPSASLSTSLPSTGSTLQRLGSCSSRSSTSQIESVDGKVCGCSWQYRSCHSLCGCSGQHCFKPVGLIGVGCLDHLGLFVSVTGAAFWSSSIPRSSFAIGVSQTSHSLCSATCLSHD